MTSQNSSRETRTVPFRNDDIEYFRVQHGLTITEACECLGLQRVSWTAMLKKPDSMIEDNSICQVLEFYRLYPETIPIKRIPDMRAYMESLTLDPTVPKDKITFSLLHGKEKASSYRWLESGTSRPSASVERLMAAVSRLPNDVPGEDRLTILKKIAKTVAKRQGIGDPFLKNSWRRENK
ncbi:hypothetical protein AB4Y43_16780 [Paraburkholderia sp. BR10872]|uniref:hypothetical protein n=1 Tax=Paraburkholderia sp. BR10872 TaxID=3236989 RepID=UPI0034D1DF5C